MQTRTLTTFGFDGRRAGCGALKAGNFGNLGNLGNLGGRALLWAAVVAVSACTGSVGGGRGGDKGNPSTPGNPRGSGNGSGNTGDPGDPVVEPPPPREGACNTFDPGPSPLRLLTRTEYLNTVADLFGTIPDIAGDLKDGGRPSRGYANDANTRAASDNIVAGFMTAAEKLSKAAMTDLSKLVDCTAADTAANSATNSATEMACVDAFFDNFGKRVWRRPISAEERQNLKAAFSEGRGSSFAEGLEAVLTVMLISPQFLYRHEQGVDVSGTQFAKLTSWEVASRLSYLLWGSLPDNELFAAADKNALQEPDAILAQARRMVKDPRFLRTVQDFNAQFMNLDQLATLDKDTMTLPAWKPELREAMAIEADTFLQHLLSQDADGKLSTYLTAPYSFMNKPLADYYGATGATGDTFQKVMLDPEKASGILSQTGFLAVHGTPDDGLTSLVFRGIFVRENLFCSHIPDPPPNAEDENPPFDETTTPREWAFARMEKPVCGSCHNMIDHIGFGFENYDAIGRWRTEDRGKPVDASGKLDDTDVDGAFTGVVELGNKLSQSRQVRDCMATQWFRFAAGRSETKRDACSLTTLQDAFDKADGDLRELFVGFTQTDAFLFRSKGDAP